IGLNKWIVEECLKQKLNDRADGLRKKNKKSKIVNSSTQIFSTGNDNELEISHQHTEKNTSSGKENSNLTLEHEIEYDINNQIIDTIDEKFYETELNEDCVGSTSSIHTTSIFNNYNIPTSNSYIESTSDDNLHFSYNSCITSDFDIDSEKANENT
ncbi:3731_t:CDS:2, partial [Cetraspora pellucida]